MHFSGGRRADENAEILSPSKERLVEMENFGSRRERVKVSWALRGLVGLSARMAAVWLAVLVASAGCSRGAGPTSRPVWELKLMTDHGEIRIPLEVMDVFVTDRDDLNEKFEIRGTGVTLVGEFPLDLRVGYGEKWEVLLGKTIQLKAHGGEPGAEKESTLALPGGNPMRVTGGSFVAEKQSGKYTGEGGDVTLSGRISIQVEDETGPKTLNGTFSVHSVTWG